MAQVIAGTYEVIQQIGSGGSGIVYLARHLRLGKLVVLKASRRAMSRRPEMLRREVDAMKNLSHTYIPQVYDFFEENGTVYTVVDYVEGESLDKPLKRGERPSQAQVIEWACELLDALNYLHTRPPCGILHADIKPANIMLTPQGDIRLIDFNIALALGEEGAVRVGYSFGYASPEHYHSADVVLSSASFSGVADDACPTTETLDKPPATEKVVAETEMLATEPAAPVSGSSPQSSRKTRLLDARSDIYSLGATLYHLLTGQRPPQSAYEVAPIPRSAASPAVAAIIQKAMQPDPDERYQSAAEMLYDFQHLYQQDPRTVRYKKAVRCTAALLCVLFLAGGALTFLGLRQKERAKNALVLAEYSQDAYRRGDAEAALQYALDAIPRNGGSLETPYTPQAQRALTQALGVYRLSDSFAAHTLLQLPSEPLKLALSESGGCLAVLVQGEVRLYDTASGQLTAQLPADPSAQSDVVFAKETLYYAGADGLCCYDTAAGRQLWQGEPATAIACADDGLTVAAIYKDAEQALVYDAASGQLRYRVDFGGQHQELPYNDIFADAGNNLLAVSNDGRWLAASFSGGALTLFDLENGRKWEVYASSAYTSFEGGFYGSYFAYAANGSNKAEFAAVDTRNASIACSASNTIPYHVYADSRGILVSSGNVLVQVEPASGQQVEMAYTAADITGFSRDGYTAALSDNKTCTITDKTAAAVAKVTSDDALDLVSLRSGTAVLASRSAPYVRVLKLENHSDAQLFTYDPSYAHSEARVSTDRSTVMLYRHDAFRLYRMDGTMICEQAIPDADQIYDQQYRRRDGQCVLEVIYYSGLIRAYSAADGSVVSEEQGQQPDKSLLEEFQTDELRIVSPLHGAPEVYDRATGEKLGTLESQDYLTYVTQVGQYVIAEYMTIEGERYGMLLDEQRAILADLPGLCDILPDGTLVFDDMRGNLRQSRIYSTQELTTLAHQ